jgi:hypothetical protein
VIERRADRRNHSDRRNRRQDLAPTHRRPLQLQSLAAEKLFA